jgi:hypothetical protein
MRLTDHVTLNFNNRMSTAAVFLDIERAFDTTWHSGLLYKLSKLKFSTNLIKLIGSFLSQRKFRVSVEDQMPTPSVMPQGSSPTLFNMYTNYVPQTRGVHLDDTCLYATDRKEGFIVKKSSAVSAQWRPDVSAGMSKLIRIKLRGSTYVVVVHCLSSASH